MRNFTQSIPGFKLLKYFSNWLKQYRWQFVLLFICGALQLVFDIFLPFCYELIFDKAIAQKDVEFLYWILSIIAGGFLIYALAGLTQDYFTSFVGAEILRDVRFSMLNHLQNLKMRFFAQTDGGVILSHFAQDLTDVERMIITDIPISISSLSLLIGSGVLLFAIEWRLAIATWAALPLASISSQLFGTKASQATYQRKQDESKILSIVQETVNAQPVIRAFGLQKYIQKKFRQQLKILSASSLRGNFFSFLLGRFSILNIVFLQLLVIGAGAYLAVKGYTTVGALVGFISLLFNVNIAADSLAQQIPSLIKAKSSLLRLEELFANAPMTTTSDVFLSVPSHEIAFKNVCFSYSGNELNLHNLNLTIKMGEAVAFIGPSGSGKSTILGLLTGLYDPDAGYIAFDGQDLKMINRASLQSHIGIVFQEGFLFNTSIRENIRLGKLDASDEEIENAAKSAEIHDAILSFPQGYDTLVGDRGSLLSGGQRQRIAIARAILRNPTILLLDEATSALDPETEAAINATINRLAKERTLITVTHRLKSTLESDRIFVLEGGKLIEQGSHEELLNLQGLYYRLWKKQF